MQGFFDSTSPGLTIWFSGQKLHRGLFLLSPTLFCFCTLYMAFHLLSIVSLLGHIYNEEEGGRHSPGFYICEEGPQYKVLEGLFSQAMSLYMLTGMTLTSSIS